MDPMPREMTIIGGGIQGTTLALAGRGVSSLIVEKEDRLLSQASLRNEGKLHLGFVYALDPTGLTTGAMVEGALTFSPLLERWCGELDWRSGSSKGFGYVVMEDSPPSTPGSVRQTVRTSSTGWVRAGSFLRL